MSKIVNLKQYDLAFTTSFACLHGLSGHLYELIDYYYICSTNNIKSAILLADGTTKEMFMNAVKFKYNFTEDELASIDNHTLECASPKIIIANNLCIVDGSCRLRSCVVYADNVFLLRCSETEFSYFHKHKTIKHAHVMQDFNLYPERYEDLDIAVVDYVKKILWQKYHQPNLVKTNTALLYLTTNCRALPVEDVVEIMGRYEFENYVILTDRVDRYISLESSNVKVIQGPIQNIFEVFDVYLYTKIIIPPEWAYNKPEDCSPRFIVECAVFGKDVIYDLDYIDMGVECRKLMIEKDVNSLKLTGQDFFIKYVREQMELTDD